jgi:biotin transport system substrate-specific component
LNHSIGLSDGQYNLWLTENIMLALQNYIILQSLNNKDQIDFFIPDCYTLASDLYSGGKIKMKIPSNALSLKDITLAKTGLLWDVTLVFGFACITALFSQISFWIGLVPITGQTFAVLIAGAFLGSKRGALSQVAYIAIGATGLPFWFAVGGPLGVARVIGPTGGYLIGFIVAAFIIGLLAERGWVRGLGKSILAMLIGSISIYLFGLAWLTNFVHYNNVFQVGFYPFIVGDCFKIVLAALTFPIGTSIIKHIRSN